ncbi:unnamed protein product [Mytilus coruscus]|uniref:Uncharacterized protein n=1 Tax=Mytilus coruscus TaxID=42192 RepID=A0A6J8BHY8_MYTCO|nr:unnamed protein product [Mytilus coruscus]
MPLSTNKGSMVQRKTKPGVGKVETIFYGKVIKEKLIPGPANDVNNNDATWEYTFKIIFKMKKIGPKSKDCKYKLDGTNNQVSICLAEKALSNIEMHDSIGCEERWAKDCLEHSIIDKKKREISTWNYLAKSHSHAETLTPKKAEATNHEIHANVPSNVTFTRNNKGKVHTTIHNVNNDPSLNSVKWLGFPLKQEVVLHWV